MLNKLPNLILDFDQILICPFETIQHNNQDDDEYVPKYTLDPEENLDEAFEGSLSNMIVDNILEFNVDNINK